MKKFTLNMGLFDKDTHQQEISTLDAYKIASNILLAKVEGATITEGKGIYTHKDGTIIIEPTLVIDLLDTTRDIVLELLDTLKVTFNQESIALQETEITCQFIWQAIFLFYPFINFTKSFYPHADTDQILLVKFTKSILQK